MRDYRIETTVWGNDPGSHCRCVGSSVTLVNLYSSDGSALLEFDDGSAHYTYALLNGVSPSAIDGSDLLFA